MKHVCEFFSGKMSYAARCLITSHFYAKWREDSFTVISSLGLLEWKFKKWYLFPIKKLTKSHVRSCKMNRSAQNSQKLFCSLQRFYERLLSTIIILFRRFCAKLSPAEELWIKSQLVTHTFVSQWAATRLANLKQLARGRKFFVCRQETVLENATVLPLVQWAVFLLRRKP